MGRFIRSEFYMPQTIKRLGAAAACAVVVGLTPAVSSVAYAQSGTNADKPTARQNPLDAKADVPGVIYRSALQGYRPYADTEPGSWIESNDRVGRIGGWRVYAKEAREPQAPAAGASAPQEPAKAAPAAHSSHKTH